jgi:cyclophilin family peptidyl-prolyl cis-trans isomerase
MLIRSVVLVVLVAAGLVAARAGQESGSKDDPRLLAVLTAEENRAAGPGQLQTLVDATRGAPRLAAAAARALGRLERRDLVPVLVPLLSSGDASARSEAANAVAQSFRGEPLEAGQLETTLGAMLGAPRSPVLYRAVARLPHETVEQFRAVEAYLIDALRSTDPPSAAARGLETMGRRRPRLAQLQEETMEILRAIAGRRTPRSVDAEVRRNAMLAVVAWQAADADTLEAALADEDFEIRRLAALVLAGAGSTFTPDERRHLLNLAMQDRSPQVRLEAVRSWGRRAAADSGCGPLLATLGDQDAQVVLAALDALGDACSDDERVTERLTSEARTPPSQGPWQREAHAFVALAKRSKERATVAKFAFATHSNPFVRLYAARAAAAMDDTEMLLRLAADEDDSVVEASLAPLRRSLGPESDAAVIAALNRRTREGIAAEPKRPYQVFRSAAMQLKGAEPGAALLSALVGALQRATAERCMTSRDARLALLERIVDFGSAAHVGVLTPLLRDIDPYVATAAASGIEKWTGRRPEIEPQVRQPEIPTNLDALDDSLIKVEMEGGRVFHLALYAEQAPLTAARVLRLARAGYYDGLTFHRVVPNFVIQGGSPNANEYCGACPLMRDEVGLIMNLRGTVGLSTRGRDTGDSQFFVNLVDSPRLDHDYTVFGFVCASDLPVIDGIQEGDRMRRVTVADNLRVPCRGNAQLPTPNSQSPNSQR